MRLKTLETKKEKVSMKNPKGRLKAMKIMSYMTLFFLLLSFMVVNPGLSAQAKRELDGAGAGKSNKVSGGKIVGPLYWKVAISDTKNSAWAKFTGAKSEYFDVNNQQDSNEVRNHTYDLDAVGLSGYRWASTRKSLMGLSGYSDEMRRKCEKSKYVWWVAGQTAYEPGRQTMWAHNSHAITVPKIEGSRAAHSQFKAPMLVSGTGKIDPKVSAEVLRLEDVQKGGKNLTIVCSYDYEPKLTNKKFPDCKGKMHDTQKEADRVTCPPPPEEYLDCNGKTHDTKAAAAAVTCPQADPESATKCEKQSPITATFLEPYTWTTTIERHNLDGYDNDPIGEDNLHDQPAKVKKTNYGLEIDKLNAGAYKDTPTKVLAGILQAAIDKDKQEKHALVDLDAANKKGMAEGGILDIEELTKPYRAKLFEQETICYKREKKAEPIYSTGTDSEGKSYSYVSGYYYYWTPWEIDYRFTEYDHKSAAGTQKSTGFWQMLSVHCNEKDFQELVAGTGATVEQAGNPQKRIAALAYSQVKSEYPETPDFGAVGSKSAQLGFYDKECPYECKKEATQISTKETGKKPGAQGGGKFTSNPGTSGGASGKADLDDNKFIFFRDNEFHDIAVDLWKPVARGNIGNPGPVLTTTITREIEGTPGIEPNENGNGNGGEFTMNAEDGTPLFSSKENSGDAPTQVNGFGDGGMLEEYNGTYSAQYKGLADLLKIKATWASTKDKPLAFNVKYEYAPDVTTTFAGVQIGFAQQSKRELGSTTTGIAKIEGKCYAEFGKNTTTPGSNGPFTTDLFQEYTGTDTTNELDDNLLVTMVGGQYTDEFNPAKTTSSTTELLVKFVRATTE